MSKFQEKQQLTLPPVADRWLFPHSTEQKKKVLASLHNQRRRIVLALEAPGSNERFKQVFLQEKEAIDRRIDSLEWQISKRRF
jgi:hypothetical protein